MTPYDLICVDMDQHFHECAFIPATQGVAHWPEAGDVDINFAGKFPDSLFLGKADGRKRRLSKDCSRDL